MKKFCTRCTRYFRITSVPYHGHTIPIDIIEKGILRLFYLGVNRHGWEINKEKEKGVRATLYSFSFCVGRGTFGVFKRLLQYSSSTCPYLFHFTLTGYWKIPIYPYPPWWKKQNDGWVLYTNNLLFNTYYIVISYLIHLLFTQTDIRVL